MKIVVCPSHSAAAVSAEIGATHALGLGAPGAALPSLPAGIRSLHLGFNDIAAPRRGLVPPDAAAIRSILALGRDCGVGDTLLVHCLAGISRSTAAAYMLACQREPGASERSLAQALRAAAPCATPNPLMVALADAALGRAGRMKDAVAAIGRGADYIPYRSFELPRLGNGAALPA